MNIITKQPIGSLGYDFIPKEFIPRGKDEYYLRNIQHRSENKYRTLTSNEIRSLEKQGNSCGDWSMIHVADPFNAALVRNCSFYGWIRIGKLEPCFVEFNNLRMPVGLYNSTIISCDISDNVVIDNVNFLSHYIIGNEVILVNVNEMATTNHSKFGNGVLKEGEKESVRIWMEICNENAGRSVLPFNGMLSGDAWLWSKYRDDEKLLQKFKEFTDKRFDTKRGYYGKIGDRTVIKNSRIIKDVWIGSDAYIKGANKLKNLTINSGPEAPSQIGEGCELVNGIIGEGGRVFYGVKAVRFIMGSHSQLKYGARLINSYLGENSTISCCEVLNSLIFPAHEQHHNNSFLCAATILGQTNMAAGATIGSNHNSRGADGEIIAGRGFWPGLCVSLKHNSKFASFTLIAKGDFQAELNIPIPFSLVSNDVTNDQLIVMPGYWFHYNMYALARNAGKYILRDKRLDKTQVIEYDFLAPDSINEMMDALDILRKSAGKAWAIKNKKTISEQEARSKGELLLQENTEIKSLEIIGEGFENSRRKVLVVKAAEAYQVFKKMVRYYGTLQVLEYMRHKKIKNWKQLKDILPGTAERTEWKNIGGQLIPAGDVQLLVRKIKSGAVESWEDVHSFYQKKSKSYPTDKWKHAFSCLLTVMNMRSSGFSKKIFLNLVEEAISTREKMVRNIFTSREKDYTNPFRKMVYDTEMEMEKVIGPLKDNPFIIQQQQELDQFKKECGILMDEWS